MRMYPIILMSALFITLISPVKGPDSAAYLSSEPAAGVVFDVTLGLLYRSLSLSVGKSETSEPKHISSEKNLFQTNADSSKIVGKKVFAATCISCHKDNAVTLAPGQSALAVMTPNSIYQSLTNGKMKQQGSALSDFERKAVAEFVTGSKVGEIKIADTAFTKFVFKSPKASVTEHSGWGNDLAASGFRTTTQSGIHPKNVASLKLKWAFSLPYQSIMRAKPAVVDQWLIFGTQFGDVFALDRNTGKIGWHFSASSSVRGAISIVRSGTTVTAYFADFSTNTYAVDVKTGKMIWSKRAGFESFSGVTGSVAVYDGRVYVPITSQEISQATAGTYECCTNSGGLVALDAKTGDRIWTHRVVVEKAIAAGTKKNGKPFFGPSGAPVWSSPTIDVKRGLVYIGTGENYSNPTTSSSDAIQALDLKTGKLIWNFQGTTNDAYNSACPMFVNCPEKAGPDLDFGMAPILVKTAAGKELLIAGQKSGVVHAITPADGKLVWQTRIGKGGMLGGIHWGMASDGKYVYAANSDNPSALDKRDTTIKASPGMYALDISSGKIIWQNNPQPCGKPFCLTGNSAAPVATTGLVFAGSLDGKIRAHSTVDGSILWEFNTAIEYTTVNGAQGKGGSIDGPAPVLSNGMLFVNSGYGMFGQAGGNLLLAFEVQDK